MIMLPTSIMQELHKLASDGSILYLVEIIVNNENTADEHIRLARNVDNVVWDGETWSKSWFEIESIQEGSSGDVPELFLYTSNIGGLMEEEILSRDDLQDATCTVYLVNSNCLDETTPIYSATFDVMKVVCNNETVGIKISCPNPYLQSFPMWKLHGSLCQYPVFKETRCGYVGAATSCDRTLATCISLSNSSRFGAFLGLSREVVSDV